MIDNSDSESKSDIAWTAEEMNTLSLSRSESEHTSDSDASPSKDGCAPSRFAHVRSHVNVNGGFSDQNTSTNDYDVSRRRTKHKHEGSRVSGSGAKADVDELESYSAKSISPVTEKKTVTKHMTWDDHRNIKGCLDNMSAHARRRENSNWQRATAHY
jgi:hypothetical protein